MFIVTPCRKILFTSNALHYDGFPIQKVTFSEKNIISFVFLNDYNISIFWYSL